MVSINENSPRPHCQHGHSVDLAEVLYGPSKVAYMLLAYLARLEQFWHEGDFIEREFSRLSVWLLGFSR